MGISLQISELDAKVVLAEFLLACKVKSVGSIDTSLNNEAYNYVGATDVIATPWRQDNPVSPLAYAEAALKMDDILLLCPDDPDEGNITLMPGSMDVVAYIGQFAIYGSLSTAADVSLTSAMETSTKRFMPITNVSIFPMFASQVAPLENIPVAVIKRDKITHYHLAS